MCGISVLIDCTKRVGVSKELLAKVNNLAVHRGPDDEGYYNWRNVGLGHRRLSILDLSVDGHQPMVRGDLAITFNGEIYNYIELRDELTKLGHRFFTKTDTEVLLAAYQEWGQECVNRFNGMWAFALLDQTKNRLFCSRDRFGKKPLHIVKVGDLLAITSEIKQMTVLPAFSARLNHGVAASFLLFGDLNYNDQTFFEGVSLLRPGHNLFIDTDTGSQTISQWYNLPAWDCEAKTVGGIAECAAQVLSLMESSVKLRLRSEVPVGCFLSGGIDSSSISCLLAKCSSNSAALATISACWDDAKIDEQKYIDAVASKTGIKALKYFPSLSELCDFELLDKVVYHQDQPIPTASHLVEYTNFRKARECGFPVMLTGQGSDEVFAGYPIFQFPLLKGLLKKGEWLEFYKEWDCLRAARKWNHYNLLRTYLLPKHRRWLAKRNQSLCQVWLQKNEASWMENAAEPWQANIRKMSLFQITRSSMPYQLYSEDKTSMAHSVESRLPFMDYRLVEYGYGLPDSMKLSRGVSKKVLRTAVKNILPDVVATRRDKLGLPAPEKDLLARHTKPISTELKELVSRTRFDNSSSIVLPCNADFGDHDTIETGQLFRMLAFSRWMKVFSVQI